MRVSYNWLKEYVDFDLSPQQLAETLTQVGVAVEHVERLESGAQGVVVAKIEALHPHPHSERLWVADLSAGSRRARVVTGADNIKPGDLVPWAAPGAVLPGNWTIQTSEFRGVQSEGMLLAETELLFGQSHLEGEGILILPEDATPGDPVDKFLHLDDYILELDLTPNYAAHCQSMIGVAREVAAITGGQVRWPGRTAPPGSENGAARGLTRAGSSAGSSTGSSMTADPTALGPAAAPGPGTRPGLSGEPGLGTALSPAAAPAERTPDQLPVSGWVQVEVWDEDLCPRYTGRVITDVRVGPSPAWLRRRLQAAGIRPINNVVDVTNYVMLELGQPQHAFDYDLVRQKKVIVRRARPGEKIRTLDGVERTLEGDDLVIADPERAIGIAGVMGGEETEITASTRNIFLESAYFSPRAIRRTSRRLGLRSEASGRFEKGFDPNLAAWAADRAVELMEMIGAGRGVPGIIDHYPEPARPRPVTLRLEKMNGLLGTNLSAQETAQLLRRLHFTVSSAEDGSLLVEIPTFRPDVEGEVDLAEEVARLYGYNRIQTTLPFGPTTSGGKDREHQLVDLAREELVRLGLDEVLTYSFINPATYDRLRLPADSPARRALTIQNPLSEDQRVMRTLLAGSLLEVLVYNASRKNTNLAIFEIGTVYLPAELPPKDLPEEEWRLGMAAMGYRRRKGWQEPPALADFYFLKAILERLFLRLGVEARFAPGRHPTLHPGRTAEVFLRGEEWSAVGWLGEVHPDVQKAYDLPSRAYLAELNFTRLVKEANLKRTFRPLPRFPAVARDLALVVPAGIPAGDIAAVIREEGGELLEDCRLFDLYQGDPVPKGYRSLAFSLNYRSTERTLTDAEVDERQARILARLAERFGARLR